MKHDFVIVGGGAIGLATAWHLKRSAPEAGIVLLEKSPRIGSGNSGKSAALFRNLFSSATSRELASTSIDYYLGFPEELAIRRNGYLWTFPAEGWQRLEGAARMAAASSADAEILEGPELAGLVRIGIGAGGRGGQARCEPPAAAIFGRRCGAFSAMALVQHYARLFKDAGGLVELDCAATSFLIEGKAAGESAPWNSKRITAVVDSKGTPHEAGTIIVAAGCWSQDLLGPIGLPSGIYAKKRQLFGVRIADPGAIFGPDAQGDRAPNVILPIGGIYLKPILSKGLIVVGCADDVGRSFDHPYGDFERALAEEAYFRTFLEPALRSVFPALDAASPGPVEIANAWAGHYDYYWPDRNPVIESHAGLVWVAGSSGSGIMKADAIGRIAAAKALGESHAELWGGNRFKVSDLSLRERNVDKEDLVI